VERVDCNWWPTSRRRRQLNLAGGMFRANKRRGFHLLCSYAEELLAVECWSGH